MQPTTTAVLGSATAAAPPTVIATVSPPTTTTSARTLLRDKMGDSGPAGCEYGDGGLQQLVRSSCLLSQRRASAPGTPLVDLAIADPPILSSSPRNGSGTAMNADLSLVEQFDSSACPARSLQNVPVRPPIAQSHNRRLRFSALFCVSPRKSRYPNDCGPVAPLTRKGSEENLKKKKNLGSARKWRWASQ